jgi:hypothetical protein
MICQLSRRPRLCADIKRLRLAVKPYLRLYLKHHADPEIKGYEHEYILEALQSGNAERAERVMREHVMVNAEAIAGCLPAPREEPTWHPAPQRAAAAPKRNPKRQGRRRPRNSVARRGNRGR